MTTPDLVLHVGMQQTGATLLQRQLTRLRPQLRAHGVAFVGHDAIAGLDHTAGWRRDRDHDAKDAPTFQNALAEVVARERRATDAAKGATVLLSSDHLTGARNLGTEDCTTFRPDADAAIAQAIAALGATRARLVLYTRRQDRLMELCYLREVQKGRSHDFLEQFPCFDKPAFDYVTLIERLRGVDGVADMRVRPVELLEAGVEPFVDDFLVSLDLAGTLDLSVLDDSAKAFRVLSRRGLRMALAMYPQTDSRYERDLVRSFLMDSFATRDDRQSRFLPKATRRAILSAYAAANRELFGTYMPDLPADSYDDNEATNRLGKVLSTPPVSTSVPAAAQREQVLGTPVERMKDLVGDLAQRNRLVYWARARYLTRKTDYFLVSFPKCGRTWLRVLLAYAMAGHAGIKVGNPMRFTFAQRVHPGMPTILATHDDSPHNKPAAKVITDKRAYRRSDVILLVRDPRDVIVSLYFHVTHRQRKHYRGSLADFIRDDVGSLASLLRFYDAWMAQRDTRRLLVVKYEDMRADTAREVRRVLDFIGLDTVPHDVIDRAVERASFERLQRAEREGTSRTKALRTTAADDPESFKVRRGKVGGYVDYLSEDDVAFIDEAVADSAGARALGYAREQVAGADVRR